MKAVGSLIFGAIWTLIVIGIIYMIAIGGLDGKTNASDYLLLFALIAMILIGTFAIWAATRRRASLNRSGLIGQPTGTSSMSTPENPEITAANKISGLKFSTAFIGGVVSVPYFLLLINLPTYPQLASKVLIATPVYVILVGWLLLRMRVKTESIKLQTLNSSVALTQMSPIKRFIATHELVTNVVVAALALVVLLSFTSYGTPNKNASDERATATQNPVRQAGNETKDWTSTPIPADWVQYQMQTQQGSIVKFQYPAKWGTPKAEAVAKTFGNGRTTRANIVTFTEFSAPTVYIGDSAQVFNVDGMYLVNGRDLLYSKSTASAANAAMLMTNVYIAPAKYAEACEATESADKLQCDNDKLPTEINIFINGFKIAT